MYESYSLKLISTHLLTREPALNVTSKPEGLFCWFPSETPFAIFKVRFYTFLVSPD